MHTIAYDSQSASTAANPFAVWSPRYLLHARSLRSNLRQGFISTAHTRELEAFYSVEIVVQVLDALVPDRFAGCAVYPTGGLIFRRSASFQQLLLQLEWQLARRHVYAVDSSALVGAVNRAFYAALVPAEEI